MAFVGVWEATDPTTAEVHHRGLIVVNRKIAEDQVHVLFARDEFRLETRCVLLERPDRFTDVKFELR